MKNENCFTAKNGRINRYSWHQDLRHSVTSSTLCSMFCHFLSHLTNAPVRSMADLFDDHLCSQSDGRLWSRQNARPEVIYRLEINRNHRPGFTHDNPNCERAKKKDNNRIAAFPWRVFRFILPGKSKSSQHINTIAVLLFFMCYCCLMLPYRIAAANLIALHIPRAKKKGKKLCIKPTCEENRICISLPFFQQ